MLTQKIPVLKNSPCVILCVAVECKDSSYVRGTGTVHAEYWLKQSLMLFILPVRFLLTSQNVFCEKGLFLAGRTRTNT